MSNFMKIRLVVAEFFHADGRADTTKLTFAFRNFAKAPKRWIEEHKATGCSRIGIGGNILLKLLWRTGVWQGRTSYSSEHSNENLKSIHNWKIRMIYAVYGLRKRTQICGIVYFVYTTQLSRWRSLLRHFATSLKVAGSIPDGVIGIFHCHNPSGHTMSLGLTQPLTEMNTRNIS